MIQFETREVVNHVRTLEAAFLVTPVDDLPDSSESVTKDGVEVVLPALVVQSMVSAIRACDSIEQNGYGVDCSVFGVLMLGGVYNPISDGTYRVGLDRNITFGRWMTEDEIFGTTDAARMAQFIRYERNRILPCHTAVKLQNHPDTYLQKIGHNLPIAITDAVTNIRFYDANSLATVEEYTATHNGAQIIHFSSNEATNNSIGKYHGIPG